jgi:hypothetical protein
MDQTPPTTSSSNLKAIFVASLKEYEKKTKKDLITHPLMAQLQTCNSPTDILAVLRTQVQQFENSTSGDDKLTRWLNPTVNVLFAFSSAIGTGVGLVGPIPTILPRSNLSYNISRFSHPRTSFSLALGFSFRYLSSWITLAETFLIPNPRRRRRTFLRARMR